MQGANVALTLARVDDPRARIVETNERFVALTGYARDNVVGRNCRFMQNHLTRQPGVMRLREFMADPQRPRIRVQLINFRANGDPFVNLVTLTRLKGPGGTPRYILGSQFDITRAAPEELLEHDERGDRMRVDMSGSGHREMIVGSYQSMAEAAASIAQGRLLIDEADRAGMLQ
ncbi:PAS domain-containing protein [Sphingomicrobium clamense]|uniref:PAS domain-containing protein n=1 Tax=Sphingomicrobium clamense TaxID=2851013 RepID=A0ABS6V296_9SPHN|nr:PAS domain-containing protein [Sphingomicrobium sp. B8]